MTLGLRRRLKKRQTVLVVDTKGLVERHYPRIRLSPYNSGSTKPNPFPRGRDTFLPPDEYHFEYWRKKRSKKEAIVELTVEHSVPDIADFVLLVKEMGASQPEEILWTR